MFIDYNFTGNEKCRPTRAMWFQCQTNLSRESGHAGIKFLISLLRKAFENAECTFILISIWIIHCYNITSIKNESQGADLKYKY